MDPVHEYKFHNYPDLTYDLDQWEAEYPELMRVESIGQSVMGREIWNVHLTNFAKNEGEDLPELYLDGGHHGNEYCGSELTILMLQYLIENYESDPDARFILDNSHVYITPMINPDGVDMDTRFNANHVDLNRNYPYKWVEEDSPWGSHGTGPGSEPEVAANIAFMEKHDFDIYITGHTGIVMLIYPWGYTREPSPDDALYKTIEEEVEAQWDIPTGQSAVILYPAAGTGKDHGYAINHAPSWTFEVDDQQFVPVSGEAISQRLQPIFECYMFLMKDAISGKWWPNLTVTETKVKGADSDGFILQTTVNNAGYANVTNATATLEIGGKSFTTLFSVGQFNESSFNITVPGDWDGSYDITLDLDTTRLMVNGSQPLQFTHEASIKVDNGGGWLASFGAFDLAFVLLVVVLGSALFPGKRGRSRAPRSRRRAFKKN